MRIGLAWAVLAAAFVGCGGKVVVDDGVAVGGGGAGGAGSTSGTTGTTTGTTSTSTTSTTTSSGLMCGLGSCSGSSDGFCACDAVCNGQKLLVQCEPIPGGASCTCIENGIKIAVCQQQGTATCSILDECCAAEFF